MTVATDYCARLLNPFKRRYAEACLEAKIAKRPPPPYPPELRQKEAQQVRYAIDTLYSVRL